MLKSLLHNKLRTASILMVSALFMVSCGSYQQASYYDDGIYSANDRVLSVEKKNAEALRIEEQESNIYGDYFGDKANEYGEILDSEVFTDIDSYSSQMPNDTIPYGEQTDYFAYNNNYNGNPGWGDNPTSLSINVYNNSWGWSGYYGWYDPYLSWGWGWNYPYYGWGWGWNNPWRYNRWGIYGSYRWGWAGYYGFGGYYGWGGYYGGYWNHPYYNRGYYGRDYAYMSGRRGYSSRIPGTTLTSRTSGYSSRLRNNSGRSNATLSRNNNNLANRSSRGYSNRSNVRRSISADAVARNRDYRTSRTTRTSPNYSGSSRTYRRSYGTTPSTRSSSSSKSYRSSGQSTRSYQSRSTAPSRNYSRSSSRSSSGSYRSSGTSRNSSSSSVRSSRSSSSSRSSGVSRSSGSRGGRSGRGGR
ncbi:hypothetical protein PY092_07625 [Muricauda sp. 334s03]|uniref:Prolyl-tRNA synthetase n=1 Tax=Flagellimonas yonaguniensis TaxID=3031325 RepID=A0ABT5XXV4_9FLAO|nr:hypothetical protein [[Muricauda] yonaguniensis]MDF0716010.1 hypothetical protein [[Muricauda] yonaguniensis]